MSRTFQQPTWDLGMMVPLLLSLLLFLQPVAPLETLAREWGPGRYSLSFLYTGQSKPREGEPSFRAMAYLNDQALFRYDSTRGRAEPLGPWAQLDGVEDWEKESELQKARGDFFLETLKDAVNYYKDPEAVLSDTTDLKSPNSNSDEAASTPGVCFYSDFILI